MAFGKHSNSEDESQARPTRRRRLRRSRDERKSSASSNDSAESLSFQPLYSESDAANDTVPASGGTRTSADPAAYVPVIDSGAVTSSAYGQGAGNAAAAGGSGKYSRGASAQRYHERKHTKHKHRRRIVAVIIILALAIAGSGVAFAYSYFNGKINSINSNFQQGLDSNLTDALVDTASEEDPFYVLLLGTDESIDREETQSTDGIYRTDSIILARVDPQNKKVTLISFPRDTKVELAGHGTQKLNAAYAFGGASLAVSTVSELAGVDISHFILVDMDGLAEVVDDLGGIEVDVPFEIDDEEYTGHLDAGLQTLNGEQALIFARSRHAYDDVGDGDTYRTANQRTIISAIASKLLSSDVLTLTDTVTDLSSYVQTDLTVNELMNYANQMSGIDTENDVYSASVPSEAVYEDGVWYNETDEDAWEEMMARVKQGLPPTEETVVDDATGIVLSNAGDGSSGTADSDASDSSSASNNASNTSSSANNASNTVSKDGTVAVKNGSGVSGAARATANKLMADGFDVISTGDARSDDYTRSYVVYASEEFADEAQSIGDEIGNTCHVVQNDGTYDMNSADILVIIGSSDAGVSG